jgi:hypothetical protein
MMEVARLQQAFGDLRPGFLEHKNFKGPSRSECGAVDPPCTGPAREIVMVEEVDPQTSERRFRPE